MLANRKVCMKCPLGQPTYITYSDTWYCDDPTRGSKKFTLLRDGFPMVQAAKWCPLVKENKYAVHE